jgi:hypothetical protein
MTQSSMKTEETEIISESVVKKKKINWWWAYNKFFAIKIKKWI